MANYKLVNADQLDADMKTVADKIREKSQLSDSLVWPDGFIDGVDQCSSLNFSVVGGTTQPIDPIENTIWINTDTEITSWAISPEQPSNPTSGMVWISNGSSSEFAFNALKKNEIKVYPLSAKQYVSSAWVDVTAMSYQGGEWVKWTSVDYLYNTGNEFEDYTGGLIANAQKYSASTTASTPTITRSETTFTCSLSNKNVAGSVVFANKIDLTDIDTLHFKVTEINGSPQAWVGTSLTSNLSDCTAASINLALSDDLQLDVSGLSGSYYVGIIFVKWDTNAMSATIESIWKD